MVKIVDAPLKTDSSDDDKDDDKPAKKRKRSQNEPKLHYKALQHIAN